MSRRIRMLALLLPVLAAAAALLAWSQTWITIELTEGAQVATGGDVAAPAIPPLALAALALIGALALAGPVFRVVLGILEALLGAGIIASGVVAISDPVAAAAPRLTEVTGIDGIVPLRALVESASLSPWPAVAIGSGAAAIAIGIGIALTARRWPERTRRYDAVRLAAVDSAHTDDRTDRLDAWDALSDGDDPTAR